MTLDFIATLLRKAKSAGRLLATMLLAITTLTAPAIAQQRCGATDAAKAKLIAERTAIVPGDEFLVALQLDMQPHWHVYWKFPGDSGEAPKLAWDPPPDGATIGAFQWPTPRAIPFGPLMNFGFENRLVLPFTVKAPANLKPGETFTLATRASWLVCENTCIPDCGDVSLTLGVAAAPAPNEESGALIAASLAERPKALTGKATVSKADGKLTLSIADPAVAAAANDARDIFFFPDGPFLDNAAKQPTTIGPDGITMTLTIGDFAEANVGEVNVGGDLAITSASGSRQSWLVDAAPGQAQPNTSGVAFVGGGGQVADGGAPTTPPAPPMDITALLMALLFAFLGGLFLNLMPCVLPVLSVKAAGLVHTAHDPKESRAHGLLYTGGVLVCFIALGAVIVALRSAGEQVGLGFQLQYPPVVALFTLLIFAVGLNLLGVFEIGSSLMGVGGGLADKGGRSGAFFTGMLAAFVGAPCVGPFMAAAVGLLLLQPAPIVVLAFAVVGFGLAFPFLALSFTPALAKLMPRPGKWMETFRQALAFPMLLTMLWLLWVMAGQTGSDGVLLVLAGAIALAFGIWLARRTGGSMVGRVVAGAVIIASIVAPAIVSASIKPDSGGSLAAEAGAEPWSEARVVALRGEGRPIFVDFTARWCVTCQVNKKLAIDSAEVKKAFADRNVAFLVADWTNRDDVIAAELAKHERAGVPLYLMYPAGGGEPEILDQLLSPALITQAVERAAGGKTRDAN